jgi:hypothetical protein
MALSKQLQRIHEAIMTIKQYGGVFGRNPTFNDVTIEGQLTFDGDIDINSDLKVSGDIETTGNVIIATSGNGIDFSATAGTGTSELFDDYEEGDWTPVVRDGSSGNASSSASTVGRYTKVGRLVQYQVQLTDINTTGLTAGNTIFVTGFPFSIASSYPVGSVIGDPMTSTAGGLTALLYQGTTVCALYNETTTGISGAQVSQITSGTSDIYITGTYETA